MSRTVLLLVFGVVHRHYSSAVNRALSALTGLLSPVRVVWYLHSSLAQGSRCIVALRWSYGAPHYRRCECSVESSHRGAMRLLQCLVSTQQLRVILLKLCKYIILRLQKLCEVSRDIVVQRCAKRRAKHAERD